MNEKKLVRVLTAAVCLLLAADIGLGVFIARHAPTVTFEQPQVVEHRPTGPRVNEPIHTAVLTVTGDVLPAKPVLDAALQSDGSYRFDEMFANLKNEIPASHLSCISLVTNLSGVTGDGYTGLPDYNTPDAMVTALKNTNFDVVLTANSHCYDHGLEGLIRTAQVIREANLTSVGTTDNKDKRKTWRLETANDITFGLTCYALETEDSYPAMPSLNNHLFDKASIPYVNTYSVEKAPDFLAEAEEQLLQMQQAGAEVTVIFMNWGTEFTMNPTEMQRSLAQNICDLGYDVIIGLQPHVIQPFEILSSKLNSSHKTFVAYCVGNALSNQRQGYAKPLTTAHTEDGMLLNLTFRKYADGSVYPEDIGVLPFWVNMHSEEAPAMFTIVPLKAERLTQWAADFGLSPDSYERAKDSYGRTMATVETNLNAIRTQWQKAADNRVYGNNVG